MEKQAERGPVSMTWRFAFRQKGDLVFLTEEGAMAKVPAWLASYLTHGWVFPGEVRQIGGSIEFSYQNIVVRLPKDVVRALCGNSAGGKADGT